MRRAAVLSSWRLPAGAVHRALGLVLGAWFALAGLSGAALVWQHEIDAWLNPGWFSPTACTAKAALPPLVEAQFAGGSIDGVQAPERRGAPFMLSRRDTRGHRWQLFVDACGVSAGERDWDQSAIDRAHLVPTVYRMHRSLWTGTAGMAWVGALGLALLLTTLAGVAAAWPRNRQPGRWLCLWWPQRSANPTRRLFDWHRTTGWWAAAFLLVMSLTGAAMCFPHAARKVAVSLLPAAPQVLPPVALPRADSQHASPDQVLAMAQAMWPHARWSRLKHAAMPEGEGDSEALYEVRMLQPAEARRYVGDTRLYVAADGRFVSARDPLRASPAEQALAAIFPLHSGELGGLPLRLLWTGLGVAPALLFATGIVLWRRKAAAQPKDRARRFRSDHLHRQPGSLNP